MRVLIAVWPATAHLNTFVPLAWALQGAGHEVRVASHAKMADSITAAGLTAIALRGSEEAPPPEKVTDFVIGEEERERLTGALRLDPADSAPLDFFNYYLIAALRIFHPADASPDQPQPMADDLVGFARHWRPDLVIWDQIWPAAGVAAAACGAASARLMWGPDYCGWTYDRFVERASNLPEGVENPMVEVVRPIAERHGLDIDPAMLVGHWTIDQLPEELRLRTGRTNVQMRAVPCTGAGVLPEWLRTEPEKPRIAFSLGSSQRTYDKDDENVIRDMLSAFAEMDAEVIATLNGDQLAGQQVPSNVLTFDYIPLTQLLSTCSVFVHHGGGGSYTAAAALRVPQVVLSVDPEAEGFAKRLTDRNAGLSLDPRLLSVSEIRERIRRVLEEPSFCKGADALYEEWQSVPSPNDVVPVLERLASRHASRV